MLRCNCFLFLHFLFVMHIFDWKGFHIFGTLWWHLPLRFTLISKAYHWIWTCLPTSSHFFGMHPKLPWLKSHDLNPSNSRKTHEKPELFFSYGFCFQHHHRLVFFFRARGPSSRIAPWQDLNREARAICCNSLTNDFWILSRPRTGLRSEEKPRWNGFFAFRQEWNFKRRPRQIFWLFPSCTL